MHYTSAEKAHRHKIIDDSIGNFHEVLDATDPERGFVSAAQIKMYRNIIDRLVVPNVYHGVIDIPRRYKRADENYIPAWPIYKNEFVYHQIEDSMPTPEQDEIIDRHIAKSSGWRQIMANFISDSDESTTNDTSFVAAVISDPAYIPIENKSDTIALRGRPFLFLDGDTFSQQSRPATIAHELEHINQYNTKPFTIHSNQGSIWDEHLNNELYAYRSQALFAFDMTKHSGHDLISLADNNRVATAIMNMTVDADLDSNEYPILAEPYRKKLAQKLAERGLDHISPNINASDAERAKEIMV